MKHSVLTLGGVGGWRVGGRVVGGLRDGIVGGEMVQDRLLVNCPLLCSLHQLPQWSEDGSQEPERKRGT